MEVGRRKATLTSIYKFMIKYSLNLENSLGNLLIRANNELRKSFPIFL